MDCRFSDGWEVCVWSAINDDEEAILRSMNERELIILDFEIHYLPCAMRPT